MARITALQEVLPLLSGHPAHRTILHKDVPGPVLNDPHPAAAEGMEQGVDDVGRPVGLREHPVPPLHFQGDSLPLKEVSTQAGGVRVIAP